MANVGVLSKMSVKHLGRSGKEAAKLPQGDLTAELPLVQIAGWAKGTIQKVGLNDDLVEGLVGEFTGINLESGEIFQSGVCYLPPGMHEQLLAAAKGLEAGQSTSVFALQINCRQATNKAGYEYVGHMLEQPAEDDPLAKLRQKYFTGPIGTVSRLTHEAKAAKR